MSNIAAYLHVSTEDQTAENQRQKIETWRGGQGLPPGAIEYYVEEGRSGADDSRPILEDLINQVRAGVYKRVIVVAFDRWFRSLEHFIASWSEMKALGELELVFNRERTRDGMTRKMKQGGPISIYWNEATGSS